MTKKTPKPSIGERLSRTIPAECRALGDEDDRRVELAFSSESPVERWYGDEILSHDPKSVRLGRLNSGAALLVNHDADQQVGVVESARIDSDGMGRAVVRFSKSAKGEEIMADVRDGIRGLVSVGYMIHDLQESERKNDVPEVRITDWEPLEVSIVSVPADASVGVGRSIAGESDEGGTEMPKDTDAHLRDNDDTSPKGGDGEVTAEPKTEERAVKNDRTEVDEQIRAIGKRFKLADEAEDLIALEGSVSEMREIARNALKSRKPVASPSGIVVPDNARFSERVRYTGKLRGYETEEAAYRAGMWCAATIFGNERAQRWVHENIDTRAMAGGIFTKGGATVPDEMANVIINLKEERGIARQLARVMPMGSDTLSVPRRTSGVTAYWRGENAALTAADMAFDSVELVAKKLTALTLISTELAEDAVIDIGMLVTEEIAYSFADKEDEAFINGDGTSTYGGIYGLRPKIIDGNHTAGAVDGASGIDTFAEVTADDLNNVMAVCPVYALQNAQWLCSQPAKALVFDALAQAAGGNTIQILGDRPRFSYLGYPIAMSQVMPTSTGDLSNVVMLAFGDFSKAVTMGERRGFNVQVLNELYAANDQIGIKATERVDIVWHDLGDTSTAGPVVALIGE